MLGEFKQITMESNRNYWSVFIALTGIILGSYGLSRSDGLYYVMFYTFAISAQGTWLLRAVVNILDGFKRP